MKKLIILLLLPMFAAGQIDQAVDAKIATKITAANIPGTIKTAVDSAMQSVIWYTEVQKSVSLSGSFNLDTLTAATNSTEVYQLILTGSGTAIRYAFVTNTGGIYTVKLVNPSAYSGASGTAFNTTAASYGVLVSITGNSTVRTYKYGRKNL